VAEPVTICAFKILENEYEKLLAENFFENLRDSKKLSEKKREEWFAKFAELEKALGSKVQYVDSFVNADIGFRGMQIHGPRGSIKVIPDQNCPADRAFLLSLDTWKLYSLGKVPKIIGGDGLKMLREASSDAVEVRAGYYAQLGCKAPGYNVNVKLT
jgi:hypothetical protein